jgi:hypothetical protein
MTFSRDTWQKLRDSCRQVSQNSNKNLRLQDLNLDLSLGSRNKEPKKLHKSYFIAGHLSLHFRHISGGKTIMPFDLLIN